jgi:hypothetical protein
MRTTALYVVFAVALASGAAAYAAVVGNGGGQAVRWAQAADKRGPHLAVSGHLMGLYPGSEKRMRVKVRNRLRHPVKVRSVRAIVRKAGPGCPARNLVARPYRGSQRVPPHRTRRVGLAIAMRPRAPDSCQGTRFPLHLKARVGR